MYANRTKGQKMFFTTTKPCSKKNCCRKDEKGSVFGSDSTPTFEEIKQAIRELAYSKWEEAGKPDGKDDEFWAEAEKEMFGENPLAAGGYIFNSIIVKPSVS